MPQAMFVIIDGLSRSGKLLLGKVLLGSSDSAFQYYSGNLERLLEEYYFNSDFKKNEESFSQLLRLQLVHTCQDLMQYRMLSINPSDSSYYKKSSLYATKLLYVDDSMKFEHMPSLQEKFFVTHTHESILFINNALHNSSIFRQISSQLIQSILVVIRNTPAQILSWYSRNYLESWVQAQTLYSPFRLYPVEFINQELDFRAVKQVPWFMNIGISEYLVSGELTENDVLYLDEYELIAVSVLYLQNTYLDFIDSQKHVEDAGDNPILKPHIVFHEHLHDHGLQCINQIYADCQISGMDNHYQSYLLEELNSARFGKQSIASNLSKAIDACRNSKIVDLIVNSTQRYKHLLEL